MYNDHTKTLSDVPTLVADPEIAKLTEELPISFQLVLAGRSKDDIELQDQVFDDILEETGGWKVERFCDKDMAEFTNVYLQPLGHKHINSVWVGGYIGSWMQFGTPDWVKGYIPTAAAGLARDAGGGLLVQCGGDAMMGSGSASRLAAPPVSSSSSATTPTISDSTRAGIKHMEDAVKDAASISYPPGKEFIYLQIGWTDEQIWDALAHAKQPQVFHYQRRIKEALRSAQRRRPYVSHAAGRLRAWEPTKSSTKRGGPSPPPGAAPLAPVLTPRSRAGSSLFGHDQVRSASTSWTAQSALDNVASSHVDT